MTESAAPAHAERFQLIRRLGSGGFGTVYEALDRKRNAHVALKVLSRAAPEELYRFKREFRAVAGLTHPNLVTLYELMSEGEEWCFSMELVNGVDCLSFVRTDGPRHRTGEERDDVTRTADLPALTLPDLALDEPAMGGAAEEPPRRSGGTASYSMPRLFSVLRQLAEGLIRLHTEGIVHRDVKPANVLCTVEGRVVLLDFGISQETSADAPITSRRIVGTPGYMSPEQARARRLTPAADWYGVGTLLYEALTGGLPFVGTPLQILTQKTTREPVAPSQLVKHVPPELDRLCLELLRRDPQARPSGEEILARVRALDATLGGGHVVDSLPLDSNEPGAFVGRHAELGQLTEAWEESRRGRTVTVLVQGESGAGKSALCKRFLRELAGRNEAIVALTGRCYEHENVPFKALDGVIDSLSRYLQFGASGEAESLLPRDVHALARLFPALLQASVVASAPERRIADGLLLRELAFAALRDLLLRLADRHPVVIYIDDLQWGDPDGIALLLELLRPPDPPALLLIVTYRSDEEATSPVLQSLRRGLRGEQGRAVTVREIPVGALPSEDAEALARELLPAFEAHRAAAVAAEAGGNTFFLSELSQSWAQGLASGAADNSQLDSLIRARVARLPESHRRLLVATAVAGQPILRMVARLAVYGEAADADEPQALASLRSERLVRIRQAWSEGSDARSSEELLPYHDRVREAVVAGLRPAELRECHLRIARALLEAGEDEPERLVFHFESGGDAESAARYAIAASARAHAALAYRRSAHLCRVALQTGRLSPAQADLVERRLADALAGSGRPKDAAVHYLALAERAPPATALELRRRAAHQLFEGGYVEEGRETLRTLLRAARLRMPETPLGHILSTVVYQLLIALHGLRIRRPAASVSPTDELRIETCRAVGSAVSTDPLLAANFVSQAIWYSLRARDQRRLSLALAPQALISRAAGRSPTYVARLIARGLEQAEKLKDPGGLGIAHLVKGHLEHFDGDWRASSATIGRAIEMIRAGSVERDTTIDLGRHIHAYNLRWRGALEELARELPAMLSDAVENGKQVTEVVLELNSGFLLLLRDDEPERAEESVRQTESRIARQRFNIQHVFALDARLMILLYQGKGAEAWALLTRQQRALAAGGFLQAEFFKVMWGYLGAVVALAGNQPPRVAAREARRLRRRIPVYAAPLAGVLEALVSRRHGRAEQAIRQLQLAEDQFLAADMMLHAMGARWRRAHWVGGDAGAELRDGARRWMTAQGIRNPERMAGMIAPDVGG